MSAEALLIASSIIAVRPPLSGLCGPRGPSGGNKALVPDASIPPKLISDCLVLKGASGEVGESSISVTGLKTTSFSSRMGSVLAVFTAVADLCEFAFTRLPRVGTRFPDAVFLTSIGRAVTLRATIELLLMLIAFDPPPESGEGLVGVTVVLVFGVPICLTFTMFACARIAC